MNFLQKEKNAICQIFVVFVVCFWSLPSTLSHISFFSFSYRVFSLVHLPSRQNLLKDIYITTFSAVGKLFRPTFINLPAHSKNYVGGRGVVGNPPTSIIHHRPVFQPPPIHQYNILAKTQQVVQVFCTFLHFFFII